MTNGLGEGPPADAVLVKPALDSALGRLLARLKRLSGTRPEPARGFTVEPPGWFYWVAPKNKDFTHYRLRVDHDDGDPDIEMSAGQTRIQLFVGSVFFLTTYNDTNLLESSQVRLDYDASADRQSSVSLTLTAASTAIPFLPIARDDARLTVFLAQDATGGRAITWAAGFNNAPVAIDGTPSTLSVVGFVGRNSLWYFDGSFATGLATL